jgi:hypothetical protein
MPVRAARRRVCVADRRGDPLERSRARSELERVARCVPAGPEGIVGYGTLGAPSYLERGG